MNTFEINILNFIHNSLSCPALDVLFKSVSRLGYKGLIWICIAVFLVLFKKTRKCGITLAAALIMCLLFGNLILKPLFARTRPFDVYTALNIIIEKPTDYSFPSGHTLASFASATVIFRHFRKWGTAALILAFLIAFSRLYLCVHYPTDVLCGLILGIFFGNTACILYRKLFLKGSME